MELFWGYWEDSIVFITTNACTIVIWLSLSFSIVIKVFWYCPHAPPRNMHGLSSIGVSAVFSSPNKSGLARRLRLISQSYWHYGRLCMTRRRKHLYTTTLCRAFARSFVAFSFVERNKLTVRWNDLPAAPKTQRNFSKSSTPLVFSSLQ